MAPPFVGAPSGTVIFVVDGNPLPPVTLSPTGVATFMTSSLSVGTHTVVANYSGDPFFNTSSGMLTPPQVVMKANTTTMLASSANSSVFGQTVTFTATVGVVMPGAGMPTGIVMFRDGAAVIGTVALNGAGVATFATNSLSVATHPITAVYSGDGNFNGSTSSILNQVVNRADTLTTVQTAVNPPVYGQTMVITASVTAVLPGAGVPQGSVNFTDGGNPIPTCQGVMVTPAGTAMCVVNNLGAGVNKVIGASYSGNTNYNPSMGSTLQTINKASAQCDGIEPYGDVWRCGTGGIGVEYHGLCARTGAGRPRGPADVLDDLHTGIECGRIAVSDKLHERRFGKL